MAYSDLNHSRQPTHVESVFIRPPIYNNIFCRISPATCIHLGLTCRVAYAASSDFSARAFNINTHLSRFFSDTLNFRSLQARTGTLISGSSALQFMDRTFYPESDLDIYVPPGYSQEVGLWLIENESYQFCPRASQEDKDFLDLVTEKKWDGTLDVGHQDITEAVEMEGNAWNEYEIKSMDAVYTFERINSHDHDFPKLKVQIMATFASPLHCVLGFHSTCVMNLISFDMAYSLYPYPTFEERLSLSMDSRTIAKKLALLKYESRGWSTLSVVECAKSEFPIIEETFSFSKPRWVGDCKSWAIHLDSSGVVERPAITENSHRFTWDPVIENGWILELDSEADLQISYHIIRSPVLRYDYLLNDYRHAAAVRHFCEDAYQQYPKQSPSISLDDKLSSWSWQDFRLPEFRMQHLKSLLLEDNGAYAS